MTLARIDVGAGTPVLLVPGYTGSKEDFRLLVQPLADAGYRAVACDQRGQYESAGPEDAAAYTVEALAEDLLGLAAELGPVHLVGHSFGGLVSRAAVLRDPAAVLSLTLLDSGPAALTGPRVEALPLLRPLLEQGGLVAVADALNAVAPVDQPPELRAFLRTRFLRNSPTALVAMADALTSEPDRVDALAAAGVRVQVVYGEADDAWSPAVQAEMARRLGCRAVVIPGALHSPAVENPAATLDALLSFF
ncbi:MAG: Alpha/beta hydrolase [Frankiales bacterium]|nr:Alpha/beta hydrolase [Frankiales bacterium]